VSFKTCHGAQSTGSRHRPRHLRCDYAPPIFWLPYQLNFKSIDKIAHGKLMRVTPPKDNIAYVSSAENLSEIARIDIEVAFDYAMR
jgi:hypothetical protein